MRSIVRVAMLTLGLVALLGCSTPVQQAPWGRRSVESSSAGELVVGTAASMPPLNMTTKTGEIIGLEIDMAGPWPPP